MIKLTRSNQTVQIKSNFNIQIPLKHVSQLKYLAYSKYMRFLGKSHLLRIMIDAVKHLKLNPGEDLRKPPIVVTAPTANAAFVVGGKTVDSAFGFSPTDSNKYIPAQASHLANMKFKYSDTRVFVIDEVSMLGASKLTKIHYRLQEMADAADSQKFMGGRSMVVSGKAYVFSLDLWSCIELQRKF